MMPITSGLIRVRAANAIAAGAIGATAAGLKVPSAVSTEAAKKNTHGTTVATAADAGVDQQVNGSVLLGHAEEVGDPDDGQHDRGGKLGQDLLVVEAGQDERPDAERAEESPEFRC